MPNITEGKIQLLVTTKKIVSKNMPVFYNPVMAFNRSLSLLLLNCLDLEKMQIALPLAGSGVRGIRLLKELPKKKIKRVFFNDYDKKSLNSIKKNLSLNNIKTKFTLSQLDANTFLDISKGFDYIDIDPFGTPNPYLDMAIKRLSRKGILAVTATDTSALCGTFPKACIRKYWAKPLRTYEMHEVGLRILIRKIQLIGGQYDKALTPIFSYSKDHYLRVIFKCHKGKSRVDPLLRHHGMYKEAGPLWNGSLWDTNLVRKMIKTNKDPSLQKFLSIISLESTLDTLGFFHLPTLIKKHKLKKLPKQEEIVSMLQKKKHKAYQTHFMPNALKSTASEKELLILLKNFKP